MSSSRASRRQGAGRYVCAKKAKGAALTIKARRICMYGGDVLESDIYRVIDQRSESDCRGIGNEEYVKLESKEERAIEKFKKN